MMTVSQWSETLVDWRNSLEAFLAKLSADQRRNAFAKANKTSPPAERST